jgi:hypothetical protein
MYGDEVADVHATIDLDEDARVSRFGFVNVHEAYILTGHCRH